ncbi:MAG: putative DNA-binding protein HU [Ignavibacteriota bacterium]|nr:MAG: putative DNA-binding protein HU [Ignavibacteriota bacterium]
MSTVTKKELIDRIAESTGHRRTLVKDVIQKFLDDIIDELGRGNRLEFRDFGVFECRRRKARMAQNPKTLDKVPVPPKRTVKFKVGRLMKKRLADTEPRVDPATGLPLDAPSGAGRSRAGARAVGG